MQSYFSVVVTGSFFLSFVRIVQKRDAKHAGPVEGSHYQLLR